jgi:hypothetical protein
MSQQRRHLSPDERAPGPRPPLSVEAACEALAGSDARAVILVEGWSDQAAVESLARRRGRDLVAEGIAVVPMGGITNIGKFAQALGPQGLRLSLAGLCDEAEAPYVARSLHRIGLGSAPTREAAEALGFFVCEADLEDELIRALGTSAVEGVIAAEGELESFRRFQDQPAQRGRSTHAHLRRFIGTRAGRKIRYGSLLADALPPDHVPRVLARVLDHHRKK